MKGKNPIFYQRDIKLHSLLFRFMSYLAGKNCSLNCRYEKYNYASNVNLLFKNKFLIFNF